MVKFESGELSLAPVLDPRSHDLQDKVKVAGPGLDLKSRDFVNVEFYGLFNVPPEATRHLVGLMRNAPRCLVFIHAV